MKCDVKKKGKKIVTLCQPMRRCGAELRGVLKSGREKTDNSTGKTIDGRSAAAWRQIDFAPLCNARGTGGGDERAAEFFRSGGLP